MLVDGAIVGRVYLTGGCFSRLFGLGRLLNCFVFRSGRRVIGDCCSFLSDGIIFFH